MQEISRGKKCLLSINIAKVGAVQNAVKIDTHIISPSGVVSCVANGYDELKKVVALIISGDVLNEVGAYSIDLRLVFADSVIIVPTFAFAEVVEGEVPCYGVSEVYVSIEGGEVVPSGNTTTIEFVSQEEFERLSSKVEDLEEQIGSGSADVLTPITFAELKALKDEGELIPGAFYRITDYLTTTKQSNTRSAGHPFDIIVQALDSRTLSEDARAIQHEGDTYFAKSNLKAWSLKYALDGDTSRFAWAQNPARPQSWSCAWGVLESKENNDASSNYERAIIDGKSKYLYRPAEPTSHLQGKQFYRDVVISSITSWEDLIYEADSAPSYSYDEELGEDSYDYPSEIRVKTASGKQVSLLLQEYDNHYYDENNYGYYITFGSSYQEVDGVYHLTPESGIEYWWEDVVGGSIDETEREYYDGSVDSLYYAFDSILPKSSKSVTEVTDKEHIYKTGGTIDTITYQSYISEEDGGKGVIYQLIDEFGNDCSYDFKNIQFKDNNVYYYTFSSSGNDASLNGTVRDNILMPYSGSLLTTIFKGAAIGNKIQRVANSKPFIFEKSATYNDICASREDASIYAKGAFDANVLLIRSELRANGAFSNNYVQYLSSNTTINGDFYANQLDTMNRNDATLTINCGRIQQCTIYGCGTLSIANTNGATTGTMGYSTINLGMNGSNVKLLWNTTASLNNRIEGLNIKAYNWGTSEVAVDITNHPVNATYPLTIAKDKSGNVKMWCEADLVE